MSAVIMLPEPARESLTRAVAEMRDVAAHPQEFWEPPDDVLDAAAKLRIEIDKLIVSKLQWAAESILEMHIPLVDVDHLKLLPDGSAPTEFTELTNQLQTALSKFPQEIKDLAQDSIHPRVKEWSRTVQASARYLFDATEKQRWAVLEAEADADIDARRVMRFSNSKKAADYLRRIGR